MARAGGMARGIILPKESKKKPARGFGFWLGLVLIVVGLGLAAWLAVDELYLAAGAGLVLAFIGECVRRGWTRKLLLWTGLLFLLLGSLAVGAGVGAWYWVSHDLPKIERLTDYRPPVVTRVLAADGSLLAEFFRQRRYVSSLMSASPNTSPGPLSRPRTASSLSMKAWTIRASSARPGPTSRPAGWCRGPAPSPSRPPASCCSPTSAPGSARSRR